MDNRLNNISDISKLIITNEKYKNITINLENISLVIILAEMNTERLSGSLEIKQNKEQPIVEVWFIDNKIVAVTGSISLMEKIKYHNWLKPQLIISLLNETLRGKAIGNKLLKVYNLKTEQIEQLF